MVIAGGISLGTSSVAPRWLAVGVLVLVAPHGAGRPWAEVVGDFRQHAVHRLDWFIRPAGQLADLHLHREAVSAAQDQPCSAPSGRRTFTTSSSTTWWWALCCWPPTRGAQVVRLGRARRGARLGAGPQLLGGAVPASSLVADLVVLDDRAHHEVPLLWRLHAVHHSVKHGLDGRFAPAHPGAADHRTLVLAPIYVLGFKGSDRCVHRHRRLPGGVQPRQRERAWAAALRWSRPTSTTGTTGFPPAGLPIRLRRRRERDLLPSAFASLRS